MSARRKVIITIDGPAGTGKSTVAWGLARRLGLDFLDTGAMYRAAALLALRRGIDPEDGPALSLALRRCDLRFDWSASPPRLMLDGEDLSVPIRSVEVTRIVSLVAAQSLVRQVLVEAQRRVAVEHPRLVSEGRDQGSVVFPRADLRFFLDADERVRAERRAAQLVAAGQSVDSSQVIADIRARDRLDTSRADGPLIRPDGAVTIDTSRCSAEEVVDRLERIARERLPGAGFIT